jgi:hypothetical protein
MNWSFLSDLKTFLNVSSFLNMMVPEDNGICYNSVTAFQETQQKTGPSTYNPTNEKLLNVKNKCEIMSWWKLLSKL